MWSIRRFQWNAVQSLSVNIHLCSTPPVQEAPYSKHVNQNETIGSVRKAREKQMTNSAPSRQKNTSEK